MNTNAANILLTLSLEVPSTDARMRTELSQAVLTLRQGRTKPCQDLLAGWLHAALFKFPWLWPTVQRANIIPLLLFRAGAAFHTRPATPLILLQSEQAIMTLGHLCQDYSYCCEGFNVSYPSVLTIVDNARLQLNSWVISHITSTTTRIGNVAQSIQFAGIECVKIRTKPRPDDPYGMSISPDLGWKIETTWNWLLQTMLAMKLLPTDNPRISKTHYGTGTHAHRYEYIQLRLLITYKLVH